MQNSGHHSKQVRLLRCRETNTVHGVSELRELLFVMEGRIVERGRVQILREGGGGREFLILQLVHSSLNPI